MYKRSEEIWTLELIKIHSYNFLVCLDQMYMYNSLETSKLMKVFDLLFFEFVWGDRGYLAMTFSGDIWSFFFFGLLLLEIPGEKRTNLPWESEKERRQKLYLFDKWK